MKDRIVCACGRLWQKRNRTPDFSRRGRVHCRCHAVLGQDEDGSWDALLITPRERFGAIRKLAGHTALILFTTKPLDRDSNLALDQAQLDCSLAKPKQGTACSSRDHCDPNAILTASVTKNTYDKGRYHMYITG